MTISSHIIESVGLRTRVLESGPFAADEAVVFVHGVPGSAGVWRYLLARVGRFARAVAYDLPGFGETDRPVVWDYSSAAYALHLAGVVGALKIQRVHLVLTDLGSVAMFWAAAHPEAFASAVLIDGGVPVGWRWHAVGRLFRTPVVGSLAERAGRFAFMPIMRLYTAGSPLPAEQLRAWRSTYDRGARRALHRYYAATPASAAEHLVPVFRRLDRPALVVWGELDRFMSAVQAERQRDSFPSAEVHVIAGSGHYVHIDAPERVAELVVPFLERQVAP
jgi:pimeloyl-ACP methyl ester carboxylesterase